jgi:hypothetical protein
MSSTKSYSQRNDQYNNVGNSSIRNLVNALKEKMDEIYSGTGDVSVYGGFMAQLEKLYSNLKLMINLDIDSSKEEDASIPVVASTSSPSQKKNGDIVNPFSSISTSSRSRREKKSAIVEVSAEEKEVTRVFASGSGSSLNDEVLRKFFNQASNYSFDMYGSSVKLSMASIEMIVWALYYQMDSLMDRNAMGLYNNKSWAWLDVLLEQMKHVREELKVLSRDISTKTGKYEEIFKIFYNSVMIRKEKSENMRKLKNGTTLYEETEKYNEEKKKMQNKFRSGEATKEELDTFTSDWESRLKMIGEKRMPFTSGRSAEKSSYEKKASYKPDFKREGVHESKSSPSLSKFSSSSYFSRKFEASKASNNSTDATPVEEKKSFTSRMLGFEARRKMFSSQSESKESVVEDSSKFPGLSSNSPVASKKWSGSSFASQITDVPENAFKTEPVMKTITPETIFKYIANFEEVEPLYISLYRKQLVSYFKANTIQTQKDNDTNIELAKEEGRRYTVKLSVAEEYFLRMVRDFIIPPSHLLDVMKDELTNCLNEYIQEVAGEILGRKNASLNELIEFGMTEEGGNVDYTYMKDIDTFIEHIENNFGKNNNSFGEKNGDDDDDNHFVEVSSMKESSKKDSGVKLDSDDVDIDELFDSVQKELDSLKGNLSH